MKSLGIYLGSDIKTKLPLWEMITWNLSHWFQEGFFGSIYRPGNRGSGNVGCEGKVNNW